MNLDTDAINAAFARHEKAALYLSGGKDSLALLYAMAPWWDRLTVVWLNTGDAPRDTIARMAQIAETVPSFLEVRADQPAIIATDGIPVDLHVPEMTDTFGEWMSQTGIRFQPRYQCCANVLWYPLHAAITEGGFTLLIRGQKQSDQLRPNSHNGMQLPDGGELLFPLDTWTDDDVFQFLRDIGVELPQHYQYGRSNIDCCTCPAYLTEFHRGVYLREQEPEKYPLYRKRLALVSAHAESHMLALMREVNECFYDDGCPDQ